jgi:ABC-type uncharacterized transport system involved in gliding motility auxiliary subunit
MTKRQLTRISLLVLAALALGFLISRKLWFRLDLTKNRAYTLSPVSRKLHGELEDQLRITYYLSGQLAAAYPQPGEIEDLLREYAVHSRGTIRYLRRDPAKAGLEGAMQELGIPALEVETVEKDQIIVATVYAGVTLEYLDRLQVIPVALSLDTLEYDVTSRIRALVRGTEREAGVIVGDASRTWEADYAPLNQALTQGGFKVRVLKPGEEIPGALPSLFVFGGAEDLDDWALYRIDRYLRGGGRVFFAPEAVAINLRENLAPRLIMDRGLLAMVSFYGATVKPELALDRNALNFSYQTSAAGGARQFRVVRYPLWIGVTPENARRSHPLTARFGGLDLFWPNPVELNPPEGVEGEVLFTTSPQGWLQRGEFFTSPEAGYLFEQEAPDTRGAQPLGAALAGTFPRWFEGMPKPVREGSEEELPDPPAEAKPGRIVVVGDADLASSLLEYTQGRRNLDFMLRAADWLGNDDEIIGIRSRQAQNGRLDKISDPEKRRGAMNFARILNLALVPLALILTGLFLAWKRRQTAAAGDKGAFHEV